MIRNRERCRPIRQREVYEYCLQPQLIVRDGQMYGAPRGDGGARNSARMIAIGQFLGSLEA